MGNEKLTVRFGKWTLQTEKKQYVFDYIEKMLAVFVGKPERTRNDNFEIFDYVGDRKRLFSGLTAVNKTFPELYFEVDLEHGFEGLSA